MQNQDNQFQPISVYFKEVWTSNIKYYNVYPNWTCGKMVCKLKPIISLDFNIPQSQIELIPFGQPKAECGQSVDMYGNYTSVQLRELWSTELDMGFYIRISEEA